MQPRREAIVPAILAFTVFAAAAVGPTTDELLQDTLKSAIVAFGSLAAAFCFFWGRRGGRSEWRWHPVLAIPVALMLYALGSMAWSHTYLAGAEAIRWFVFALLALMAVNTVHRDTLSLLAWGVAAGGGVASLWAALQFFFGFALFPQGPHPASTFVNRNFFAEFAACALPFAAMAVAPARSVKAAALASAFAGAMVLGIGMTGTRSALLAIALELAVAFPFIVLRWRAALGPWTAARAVAIVAPFVLVVGGLGFVATGDPQIAAEARGSTPLARAIHRGASVSRDDPSLGMRERMWRATAHMIAARPLAGVGAGAWENEIPLYQPGESLEPDFYAHSEFLQLVAEYGLAGWLCAIGLLGWLCRAAWVTSRLDDADEAVSRAFLLASLAALLVVSCAGFPWHLAATGAVFALALGALAASDVRVTARFPPLALVPAASLAATAAVVACMGVAVHVTMQAVRAEHDIVRATRIALAIGQSANPQDAAYDAPKREMLGLLHDGVRINRHLRQLTPIAADEMARWGDWQDAVPLWESVLSSRPNVVAILCNVSRGYSALGDVQQAAAFAERAARVQSAARSNVGEQGVGRGSDVDGRSACRTQRDAAAAGG